MKKKLGNFLLLLGVVALVVAVIMASMTMRESIAAEQAAASVLDKILNREPEGTTADGLEIPDATDGEMAPEEETEYVPTEETVVDIDGYGYIGYLTFPTLDLQLPVMSEWDYARLKISPCRYVGSVLTDDIVIAAHNNRHFGPINDLELGDSVIFTDMNGYTVYYEVVESSILAPTAIEEMTSGEFDLTLFTCTLGGASRVTVRCDRVMNE